MKKAAKIFIFFILSVMTASCACAGLSACFANGGTVNNGAGGAVGKWDEYDGVMLAFMEDIAYNDGDIDDSKVMPELNCLLGKKYYMAVDFEIESPYDNDGRATVTASVKIQPAAMVKATIQDTNTASVKEETEDGITSISATYKIPDKADSVRNMRLVIQFEAIKSGLADVELSFESSGEIQGVKTLKIEKSAVMGYTEGLEYKDNTVMGISDKTVADIVFPTYYSGHYIDYIAENAFQNYDGLTSVTIPNSVKGIGGHAFSGCGELTTVMLSESVTRIQYNAFKNCNKLQYNEYENALYLGNEANKYVALVKARDTEIASCTVNENIKSLCSGAFEYCSKLTSIILPNGITNIGFNAFYNCRGLTSVIIPESVTEIGNGAFYNCRGLTDITIPNGVTFIDDTAFQYCIGLINVTIPSSVTNIEWGVFYDCSALASITFTGTTGQWKAIQKYALGNDKTGKYVVHCTDGDLTKEES